MSSRAAACKPKLWSRAELEKSEEALVKKGKRMYRENLELNMREATEPSEVERTARLWTCTGCLSSSHSRSMGVFRANPLL